MQLSVLITFSGLIIIIIIFIIINIIYSVLWHCWLGVRKSIQPVKTWVMRSWCGARCKWFACGPADAAATSSSLASLKSRMVFTFLVPAYPVCPWKQQQQQSFYGPLSGTTRVSRYQKKYSPTHHPDHGLIFISFFRLLWSIASSLFKLCAWQSLHNLCPSPGKAAIKRMFFKECSFTVEWMFRCYWCCRNSHRWNCFCLGRHQSLHRCHHHQ